MEWIESKNSNVQGGHKQNITVGDIRADNYLDANGNPIFAETKDFVHVRRTGGDYTSGSNAVFVCNSVVSDADNLYDTSTGTFTCANAGLYQVNFSTSYFGTPAGGSFGIAELKIRRSGTDLFLLDFDTDAESVNYPVQLSGLVQLTVGQNIQIIYSANEVTISGNAAGNNLTIARIF